MFSIDHLFSGKIRVKLLTRLLLNPSSKVYLRELERDLGVSSNTVRLELNKLSEMKLIVANDGDKTKIKKYQANATHPLFNSLRSIIMKYVGLDYVLEEVISQLGDVRKVYLTGDLAEGRDSPFMDLVLVGSVDKQFMNSLVEKAEELLSKKIRIALYASDEFHESVLNDISRVCILSKD